MTVFKPIVQEASTAAKVAVGLATGKRNAVSSVAKTKVSNGVGKVPSVLLQPIVVTKQNIGVVVKDGGGTWAQICSGLPSGTSCPKH
jgi:D-xylose transport system substrate-binding protein